MVARPRRPLRGASAMAASAATSSAGASLPSAFSSAVTAGSVAGTGCAVSAGAAGASPASMLRGASGVWSAAGLSTGAATGAAGAAGASSACTASAAGMGMGASCCGAGAGSGATDAVPGAGLFWPSAGAGRLTRARASSSSWDQGVMPMGISSSGQASLLAASGFFSVMMAPWAMRRLRPDNAGQNGRSGSRSDLPGQPGTSVQRYLALPRKRAGGCEGWRCRCRSWRPAPSSCRQADG